MPPAVAPVAPPAAPRLVVADRTRPFPAVATYDDLLPPDHLAREVWDYVGQLDLAPLYRGIRAVVGHAGRAAIDPRTLAALWLYACLDGVLSARYLAGLLADHRVYQWLAAGQPINYHTLSDFRTAHADWLDQLLTDSVAVLLHQGLVALDTVAQDGLRLRASAGSASFHRQPTLERCRQQAEQYLGQLRRQEAEEPGQTSRRHRAAQQRAARERRARLAQALVELAEVRQRRQQSPCKKQRGKEARASSTDPEARVMKMADGGFRPAYNVQLAVTAEAGVVLGVAVTNAGSDAQEMAPLCDQLRRRYGRQPQRLLVDGSYAKKPEIDKVSGPDEAVAVYAPVKDAKKKQAAGQDPFVPLPGDSPVVAAWRRRMGQAEAQELYKRRSSSVEWVNARARGCNLYRLLLRGRAKARAVLLWFALGHNWLVARRLRAARGQRANAAA